MIEDWGRREKSEIDMEECVVNYIMKYSQRLAINLFTELIVTLKS